MADNKVNIVPVASYEHELLETCPLMSDPRLSTPSSSAGGRLPPIARPDWPWAGTYSQKSQQSSPHVGSMHGTNVQSGWDPRSSVSVSSNNSHSSFSGVHQGNSTPKPSMNFSVGESTRQWTFTVCRLSLCSCHLG